MHDAKNRGSALGALGCLRSYHRIQGVSKYSPLIVPERNKTQNIVRGAEGVALVVDNELTWLYPPMFGWLARSNEPTKRYITLLTSYACRVPSMHNITAQDNFIHFGKYLQLYFISLKLTRDRINGRFRFLHTLGWDKYASVSFSS